MEIHQTVKRKVFTPGKETCTSKVTELWKSSVWNGQRIAGCSVPMTVGVRGQKTRPEIQNANCEGSYLQLGLNVPFLVPEW